MPKPIDAITQMRRTDPPEWFEAQLIQRLGWPDAKIVWSCGHRHPTYEDAVPCWSKRPKV